MDAFEGFARSFLLAAFRIPLAEPRRADQLADRYAAGIAAGTAGPEAWPRLSGLTQPLVEASAVALGLLQTMPAVWPRLGETAHCDTAAIDERLDALLALRRPGGMFSDGGGARYDYYSSWVFSLYSAFWARHDGARRPLIAQVLYRQALEQRVVVRSLTDDDGRPVLLGRSLIYRAAVSAGLWSPALFPDADDGDAGWVATVATATLDQVMAGGAAGNGVLSLGWGRPCCRPHPACSGPPPPPPPCAPACPPGRTSSPPT